MQDKEVSANARQVMRLAEHITANRVIRLSELEQQLGLDIQPWDVEPRGHYRGVAKDQNALVLEARLTRLGKGPPRSSNDYTYIQLDLNADRCIPFDDIPRTWGEDWELQPMLLGVMGPNAAEVMSQLIDSRRLNHAPRLEMVYSSKHDVVGMKIEGILVLNDRGATL